MEMTNAQKKAQKKYEQKNKVKKQYNNDKYASKRFIKKANEEDLKEIFELAKKALQI